MLGIGFIDSDNADGVFGMVRKRFVNDRGAEENLVGLRARCRVDHFGRFNALVEKTDSPIHFTQPTLAVQVITVFATVAVTGRPTDDIDHRRALHIHELFALVQKSPVARRRHVIFRIGRQSGKFDFLFIVV